VLIGAIISGITIQNVLQKFRNLGKNKNGSYCKFMI